ncbi:dockerin type I domain-containing protein, partial [Treponema sp.]|uniref:dockerin type I domain-containing protein n=1 Tax=Treponema sp. TaxID=166 RepID=UPI00298D9673
SYADDVNITDLNSIASSLGADTDYMSIADYHHNYDDITALMYKYTDYFWNCSVLEASYYPNGVFSKIIQSGSSIGISALEVLSHNKVIKPSDIQPGANTLNEISYNDDVDKIITSYQFLQGYTEFNNYTNFMKTNLSYDEQINQLIETAENNMKNNRYFFISVSDSEKFSHAVCGIGIADGVWEWNGEEYDKCILTLDSNENATGFNEKSCIYINSETKSCYIPSHEMGTDNNLSFAVVDDDTLLNYKGAINPSETINTDISDIKHISYNTTSYTKLYAVNNGNKTLFDETSSNEQAERIKFIKADSVHINMNDETTEYPHFRYINSDRWINIEFQNNGNVMNQKPYNADVNISDNEVHIKCNKDDIDDIDLQIRMNEGTYNYSPFFWWNINLFDFADEINVEVRDNGILLKNNGHIKATITPYCYLLDENGHFKFNSSYSNISTGNVNSQEKNAVIETDNNVLISIENQEIIYYIDKNGDDVYDDIVEKGDVNCDGFINASDASLVLAKYASDSANSSEYIGVGNNLGDYNGDGVINASDASDVLAYYADISSGKIN